MDLSNASYNRTRNTITVHGIEYTVKKQRGRYYIHAENRQITVTETVSNTKSADYVFDYIFNGGFENYPCIAMDYWIMRWRNKIKISTTKYKELYISKTKQ